MRRLACLTAVLAWQVTPTFARTKSAATHYDAVSECSSTTINYITQSLPQQCLRTDWSRSPIGWEASIEDIPRTVDTQSTNSTSEGSGSHVTTAHSAGDPVSPSPTDSQFSNTETDARAASSSVGLIEPPPTPPKETPSDDDDSDPLSDHGNFLSFEQWKAQMLEKAGQSPDHVIGSAVSGESTGPGLRRQGIENALESLGDEGEIELDFHGFVSSDSDPGPAPVAMKEKGSKDSQSESEHVEVPIVRSKEAGTTSKERFNYASFDCAATVLKTSKGSKGATWILSENKDSYLLNKCSESNKHFIVELCNDIWIDTVVLGNFEFFSSTFRHFKVSISDQYPVKSDKWRELGTFEARNTRGVQAFMVEDGRIWGRYLKVELLTHYGKEYYCPISLLRVHGKTMMDDFRNEMKGGAEQDDMEDDEEAVLDGISESTDVEVSAIPPVPAEEKALIEKREPVTSSSVGYVPPSSEITSTGTSSTIVHGPTEEVAPPPSWSESQDIGNNGSEVCVIQESEVSTEVWTSDLITPAGSNNVAADSATTVVGAETAQSPPTATSAGSTDRAREAVNTTQSGPLPTTPIILANASDTHTEPWTSGPAESQTNTVSSKSALPPVANGVAVQSNYSVSEPTTTTHAANSTQTIQTKGDAKSQESPSSSSSSSSSSSTSTSTKSKSTKASSSAKASSSVPATQDSFFRSVHKRLQMLESNSTLSLQYIEEQSRILRDAFGKAEKRQLLKTSNFLETLNNTVLGELRTFRTQYDQIWQSTILELASQREQSQKEVRALGERLGLLADELVWQKRVVYLQFILIILSLGLVIFSKNGVAGGTAAVPLELSLLQSIQHLRRSNNGLSVSFAKHYSSSPDSQPATPGTPSRPSSMGGFFGRKAGHRRYLSDGITSGEETGIGTEVTTSPEQRRRIGSSGLRVANDDDLRRRHVRTLSDETTLLASGGEMRSQSPSIDIPPAHLDRTEAKSQTQILINGSAPNVAEYGTSQGGDDEDNDEDEDEIPSIDPIALKRAASSPALGRHGEGPVDSDGTEAEPEISIKVENGGSHHTLSVPGPSAPSRSQVAPPPPPLSAR